MFAAGAAGGTGAAAGGAGAGAAGAGAGGLGGASTAALGAAPLAAGGAEGAAGAGAAAAAPAAAGAAPAAGGIMGPIHALLGQMAQVGGPGMPSTGGSGLLGQFGMGGSANNFLRGFAQGYNLPVQTFQAPGLNASTFGQFLGQRALGGGQQAPMPQTPDAAQLLALLAQMRRHPFQ